MWRNSLNNPELEFLAEQTTIDIFPNFRREEIELTSGTYGPFRPNKKVTIPLWLAMQFKKNKQCKIVIPPFLEINYLNNALETEKNERTALCTLPEYFFEICQILFSEDVKEDFADITTTRGLVEDLIAIRTDKINKALEKIDKADLSFKAEGFNQKEIEKIRPFIYNHMYLKLQTLFPKSKAEIDINDLLFVKSMNDDADNPNAGDNNAFNDPGAGDQ